MRKYYFSRAETRSMALDHPVGDATGGVAYGEKNDPVSATISLVTMGKLSAGFTAFSSMTLMQGITFAGAALNLVGNISGNKTLQKIGMVAGIAGGIGQLAGIQGPKLGQTFGFGETGGGITPAGAMRPPPTSSTGPASGNIAPVQNGQQAAQSYAANNLGTTTVSPAAAPAPSVTTPVQTPFTNPPITTPTPAPVPPPAGGSSLWEATKGAGKSLMEFTKEYPAGAIMLGNTATTVADYLSGKTDAELDALEAQKNLYGAQKEQIQEAINLERDRRRRLNEGYQSVNTGINVNPNISMQPGLIAQNMQQA